MSLVERMCTLVPLPPRLGLRKQPKCDLLDLLDCKISIRFMRIDLVLAKPDFCLLLGTSFFTTKTGEMLWPISHDASNNFKWMCVSHILQKRRTESFPVHSPTTKKARPMYYVVTDRRPPQDAARALRNREQLPPCCKSRVPSSRDLPNRPSARPLLCPILVLLKKKRIFGQRRNGWEAENLRWQEIIFFSQTCLLLKFPCDTNNSKR